MGNYDDAKKFNGVCFSIFGCLVGSVVLDANVFSLADCSAAHRQGTF